MAANAPDVQGLLHQAMEALKRDDRAQARDLLTTVIEMDDRNEQAWLWMSGAVDSPVDQRICLENVLTINPGSTAAREGLTYLEQQAPVAPPPTTGTPAAAAPPAPGTVAPPPPPAPGTPTTVLPAEPPPAAPVLAAAEPAPPALSVAAAVAPPSAPAPWESTAPPASAELRLPDWALAGPGLQAGLPEWVPPSPDLFGSTWGGQGVEPELPAWAGVPAAGDDAGPALPAWAGPPLAPAGGQAAAGLPDWGAAAGGAPPQEPPVARRDAAPGTPADPWEALRGQAGVVPAPGSTGLPGMPAATVTTAPPATDEDENFGGLAPFDFDPTAPLGVPAPPAASPNPWSTLDGRSPGLVGVEPVPSPPLFHPEGETGTAVALDSPWAGTAAGNALSGAPAAPSDDPFLHIRQPAPGNRLNDQDERTSSLAMIARPPVAGRTAGAATVPCPSCGEMVTENALSCPRCQYRFYAPCPHCGDFLDLGNPDSRGHDKCPRCGQAVNKLALGQAAARHASRRAGPGIVPAANPAPLVLAEPGKKNKRGRGAATARVDGTALAWQPGAPATPRGPGALMLLLRLIVVVAVVLALIYLGPMLLHSLGVQTALHPGPTPTALPTP